MLILSRKPGDSILIDGGIRLTVLEVRGRTIRLGIEAPREVSVQREELVRQAPLGRVMPPLGSQHASTDSPALLRSA